MLLGVSQAESLFPRFLYGTDLTQRRTPSRVLGYHSRATRTRSSICIIGLELAVVLALERKMVRAVLKI